MRTYGYRRTLAEANEAANRQPENRLIYAQQQVDWFYTDLLKAQHQLSRSITLAQESWWCARQRKAERDLAEAHERHLKACAALGPADIRVRRRRLSDDHEFVVRDACGFIRWIGNGYWRATEAQDAGRDTAINLGLEVE